MKRLVLFSGILLLSVSLAFSQGYQVGDKATDFSLKNIDGKLVSLSNYKDAKGAIVVFTCNHCPYAKAYQDRIISLDKKYGPLGYPVIAISPNDPQLSPEDSFDEMVKRSKEKGYTFPYLLDENQEVYKKFGATRTPHVFLLQKQAGGYVVKYIGAIDDNYEDASKVATAYLANAVDALLGGKEPNPAFTKAIGCTIKDKRNK